MLRRMSYEQGRNTRFFIEAVGDSKGRTCKRSDEIASGKGTGKYFVIMF